MTSRAQMRRAEVGLRRVRWGEGIEEELINTVRHIVKSNW